MKEEWRVHDGYRKIEVSNLGNVRTVWDHKIKNLKPFEVKTKLGSYLRVSVTSKYTGDQREVMVHLLVADCFIDKPKKINRSELEIDHIDRDKHNNRVDNLEWVTRSENLKRHYSRTK